VTAFMDRQTFCCVQVYEKAVNTIPIEASRKERNRVVAAIVIVEWNEGQGQGQVHVMS
jgi:hypothetical protein